MFQAMTAAIATPAITSRDLMEGIVFVVWSAFGGVRFRNRRTGDNSGEQRSFYHKPGVAW
jgi:hypothetical protein